MNNLYGNLDMTTAYNIVTTDSSSKINMTFRAKPALVQFLMWGHKVTPDPEAQVTVCLWLTFGLRRA